MQCALITTRLPLSGYLQLLCPTATGKVIQLCLTAKRAFYQSFGPLTACVARRVSVPQLCYMHNNCVITFELGLAAIRSLYPLDRLPPALRGVKRFDNCISAWPYGQAHAFYPFWPAHVSMPQL